jgi:ankyrin repeat protein
VLELLATYKADLELLADGISCAHSVTGFNWTKCLLFLKEAGANLNILSSKGRTLTFSAVVTSATDSLRLLLELGVEVDIRDSRGETTLHIAIEMREIECVILLLRHGASVESSTECYKGNRINIITLLILYN